MTSSASNISRNQTISPKTSVETTPHAHGISADNTKVGRNPIDWKQEPEKKAEWDSFKEFKTKMDVTAKIQKMPSSMHEETSVKLHSLNNKLAELEKKFADLEKKNAALQNNHATSATTAQHAGHAAAPSNAKLKKMAGAIKNAFANAPWEKIGKGALYAAAGVAGFALLSNPIGVLGMVGMVMGSSLLPTALGLAGAAAAVYQTHVWLGKKSDQASPTGTGTAAAGNHGNAPFSQSLGNPI